MAIAARLIFMKRLQVCLAYFALVCSISAAPGDSHDDGAMLHLKEGPLLGHVGPDQARLWVKASASSRAVLRASEKPDLSGGIVSDEAELGAATDFAGVLLLKGLSPGVRYYYRVELNGQPAMLPPYPAWVAAPPEGRKGHLRFVFGSCVGYNGFDSAATWADMAARTNFDLLLQLGDNHYGDSTDPARIRRVYGVQRTLPGYRAVTSGTPTYAIWDNHDYGPEPCDRTAPNRERALELFRESWPNPAFGETNNPGVYFRFSRGDVDFFMLDDRYHRDPNRAPEDGKKSQLGERQLAWLKRELLASTGKLKFLAAGGEWQSNGSLNSWASFKRERDDIFKFIDEHRIEGVVLLSGDRHTTVGYQVAGRFLEISSGPFGSKGPVDKPSPETFMLHDRARFYCIFDVNTTGEEPGLTLEVYQTGEGLIDRRAFNWAEISGRQRVTRPAKPVEK